MVASTATPRTRSSLRNHHTRTTSSAKSQSEAPSNSISSISMSNGNGSLHVSGADAGLMAEPAPAPHPADAAAAASATAAAQQQAEAAAAALLHAEQHHQQQQQQQHEEAGVEGEHDEGAYEDASFGGVHAHHLQQEDNLGEGAQQQQTNLAAEALMASSMAHQSQQHHHHQQQQHERNVASSSGPNALKPIAFVAKLHDMVSSTDPAVHNLIHWCGADEYADEVEEKPGDAFVVTDMGDFSREVLPRFFKHNNWQSFQRQLNLYGFRKLNDAHRSQPNAGPTPWVFRHRYFKRANWGLLVEIQRKNKDVTDAAASQGKRGGKKRKMQDVDESKSHGEGVDAGWNDKDTQEVMQRYIEEKFSVLNQRIEVQNEALREYGETMALIKQRSVELASVSVEMLATLTGAVAENGAQASVEARNSHANLPYLRTALNALSAIVIPAPPVLSPLDAPNEASGTAIAGPSSSSAQGSGSVAGGSSSRAEKRKQQPEPATLEQLLASYQTDQANAAAAAASSSAAAAANDAAHDKTHETTSHEANYFAAAAAAAAAASASGVDVGEGEGEVDTTGHGHEHGQGEEIDEDAPGEETFAEAQQHQQHEDEHMQDANEVENVMGAHELHHHAQA